MQNKPQNWESGDCNGDRMSLLCSMTSIIISKSLHCCKRLKISLYVVNGIANGSAKYIIGYAYHLATTTQWVPIDVDRDAITKINVLVCKFRG